jgi:hypothetical protein
VLLAASPVQLHLLRAQYGSHHLQKAAQQARDKQQRIQQAVGQKTKCNLLALYVNSGS